MKIHNKTGDPGLDPGKWVYVVLMVIVLVLIVAALLPTLTTSLASYAANETTFGPVLETLVPLVVGAAILIAIVVGLLVMARRGKGL